MTNDIFAKALAPALGFEADQVGQYVDKVLELALEELLLNGTVTIAGIGTLKRIYHPSEAREYEPGKLYLVPPRQSVELVQTDSTDDFIYEAAIGQFNMDEDRASKFSKGIALTVQKVLDVASEMEFGNIGSLRKFVDGKIELTPSGWLIEMLNKSYSHLEPTPISSTKPRETSEEKPASSKPEAASAAGFPEQNPFASSEPARKPTPEPPTFSFEEKTDKEKGLSEFFTPSSQSDDFSGSKKGTGDISETFVPASAPSSQAESARRESVASSPSSSVSKEEKDENAWLYEEPKKDYSPIYITLGAIALVAVLIGMALLLFSGKEEKLPEKESAKIEQQQEQASETAGKPESVAKPEEKKPASESADNQKAIAKQEPPANKSEKPVIPPAAKIEQPKPEQPKAAPAKTEPAKPEKAKPELPKAVAQKPEPPKPPVKEAPPAKGVPAEFTKKVDLKKGGYAISVGSFPDKAVAQKVAGDYQKKGMTTTLWETEVKGTLYNRVLIGSFSSQDEARAAIKKHASLLPQGAFPVTVK